MMKSIAIISLLTSVVLAQSSPPSSIPAGISSSCSNFLTTLNSDTSLSACTSALTTATAAFAPSNASPSPSALSSALQNLCSATVSSACPDSLLRGKIAAFYSACSAELTSSLNQEVVKTYDVLYSLIPFKEAICTKDDSGDFCVTKTKAAVTQSGVLSSVLQGGSSLTGAQLQSFLVSSPSTPNTSNYRSSNLLFLFTSASESADTLCTTCTRNILTSYINFESDAPYAPGIAQSTLLAGQSDIYVAVQSKCPSNFMNGAVQAAGGLSGGSGLPGFSSSGAVKSTGVEFRGLAGLLMGVVTLAVASQI